MPQTVQRAEELLRLGDRAGAEALYRQAVEEAPGDINALHRAGVLAFQRGALEDSLALLGRAAAINPDEPVLWSDLGLVQASAGQAAEAVDSYDRALALRPGVAETHCRRADALRLSGRTDEALAGYDAAIALDPAFAQALNNRGLALMALGRREEALASYDAVLAFRPDYVLALCNRGRALQEQGRRMEALESYDAALALKPGHLEALNNRGAVLQDLQWLPQALDSFDEALRLKPDFADALNNRGNVLKNLGRMDEALASYGAAIVAQPRFVEALCNRGFLEWTLGRPGDAVASYDAALEIDPGQVEAWNVRAIALTSLNRPIDALDSYDAALALNPDFADALGNKGMLLTELGLLDQAREALERAIDLEPTRVRAYYNLTLCRKMAAAEPRVLAMEALARGEAAYSIDDRIYLHYALAKAYADAGERERSFEQLTLGARLKRGQIAYEEATVLGQLEQARAAYPARRLRAGAGGGHPSAAAIFIVGMPRSGSTLVEQILASHPAVFATGESDLLVRTVAGLDPKARALLADPDGPAGEVFRQVGEAYSRTMALVAPDAARVTDKALENFRDLGLIHLALPNARILHTRRDPIDTCLSCFQKLFGGDLPYSYNLGELGRYYRAYEALMAHWRAVLPPGVMLEVDYEDTTADLESAARRIIAHCGLEWDDRCLDFHRTNRWVHTASAAQVREPVYRSSVGKWRAYEPWLGPLIAALKGGPDSGNGAAIG
jgi:tetratricopeptide (TPR) repeat protein